MTRAIRNARDQPSGPGGRALVQVSHHPLAADYRRPLLEAAARAGAPSFHVQCAGTIRVNDVAAPDATVELDGVDALSPWLDDALAGHRPIALTGLGGVANTLALRATKLFARQDRLYDVQDDLSYGARGLDWAKFAVRDRRWRAVCGGTVVLNKAMTTRYRRAKWLDNASHLSPIPDLPQDPRLVYIGSIDRRLDLPLLEEVSRFMPVDIYGAVHSWTPELEGELKQAVTRSGVRYFGRYRNEELADVLKGYSVGLIPYHTDMRLTRHVNPDKIYHYLNAGLGVVTTAIPQSLAMTSAVTVIERADEIVGATEDALRRRNQWNWRDYTWSQRWEDLQELA